MPRALLALVLLLPVTVSGGKLDSVAWVTRSNAPSAAERQCTDYSLLFWSVSLVAGAPTASPMRVRTHVDPLPFHYSRDPDRAGDRYVVPTQDGWLVGFDAGEFGGGLWWFSRDGRQSRRIRPDPSSPTNPDDVFHSENVLGLPEVAGQRLVLMGLDHMTGRSGRIFRVVPGATGWTLLPVAVLDAEPEAWLVDGARLLFVTESGLWSSDATGATRRLYEIELGSYSPTSLIRGSEGALYLGLRHYVLKLEE